MPIQPVSLGDFKRTKIIATIGPPTNNYESIKGLIDAGANGIRLNFSHGTNDERDRQIDWVRKASKALKKPVAIIQDLQGPKIRLGDFEGVVDVKRGGAYSFRYKADHGTSGELPTQYDLSRYVKRGERIFLFDGKVRMRVTGIKGDVVRAEAENDGVLVKRKGINLPDTDFGGDIITAKDKADLIYGSNKDLDYVAMSFVQSAADITSLRNMLKNMNSTAKVIAKIETRAAIGNMEEIVKAADAVMIARGDLAVETAAESVPIEQRRIIGLGLRYNRPTIVATQMLGTMTENPEPSRAEVSDVATAVFLGTDCVMLSDETANGKYPLEAVMTMKKVIRYTEKNMPLSVSFNAVESDHSKQSSISKAIISLAKSIEANAIVAETRSGATALAIASLRPPLPIIAAASDRRVAQQLAICYGIKSYERPVDPLAAQKLTDWLRSHKILNKGDIVVSASGRYPGVVGTTDTIKVRVLE